MEYKDFMEVMPDSLIKKLNGEYSKLKVETLSSENGYLNRSNKAEEKLFENNLKKLYKLLSKSNAYFSKYKVKSAKVTTCQDINLKHKDIIKSLSCCNDFSMYEGYLVPRYLTFDRCFCDHYGCEMDILRTLIFLLLFKNTANNNIICQMAIDRIDVINSLVIKN